MSVIELTDLVIVVRVGAGELPPPGTAFSGAVGRTLEDAAAYVPHGTIRFTTVSGVLAGGGSVTVKPEVTRSGRINEHRVDVIEARRHRRSLELYLTRYPREIGFDKSSVD